MGVALKCNTFEFCNRWFFYFYGFCVCVFLNFRIAVIDFHVHNFVFEFTIGSSTDGFAGVIDSIIALTTWFGWHSTRRRNWSSTTTRLALCRTSFTTCDRAPTTSAVKSGRAARRIAALDLVVGWRRSDKIWAYPGTNRTVTVIPAFPAGFLSNWIRCFSVSSCADGVQSLGVRATKRVSRSGQ